MHEYEYEYCIQNMHIRHTSRQEDGIAFDIHAIPVLHTQQLISSPFNLYQSKDDDRVGICVQWLHQNYIHTVQFNRKLQFHHALDICICVSICFIHRRASSSNATWWSIKTRISSNTLPPQFICSYLGDMNITLENQLHI